MDTTLWDKLSLLPFRVIRGSVGGPDLRHVLNVGKGVTLRKIVLLKTLLHLLAQGQVFVPDVKRDIIGAISVDQRLMYRVTLCHFRETGVGVCSGPLIPRCTEP